MEISPENQSQFHQVLSPLGSRTALISLHGCGDLQETLINIFLKSNIPLLLTIGCCYHKTKKDSKFLKYVVFSRRSIKFFFEILFSENNDWILSDFVKSELSECPINGSALRIGAELRFEQYSKMSEAEKKKRLESLVIRSLVEVFYQRMGKNKNVIFGFFISRFNLFLSSLPVC